jgi:glycosyltransferase involved in cell wall biosynthesis
MPPRLLYTSFDQVPGPKGASTHIEAFARAVGLHHGSLILATPGPRDEPARLVAPGVRQIVLGCPDRDLIGRVLTFRAKLLNLLRMQTFDLIHFRSIFEGYPLTWRHVPGTRLLYEANGFPSVELKYAYPSLRRDAILQNKIEHQEQVCLAAADQVLTVSQVSRDYLAGRGVPLKKVAVIRNGVDLRTFPFRSPPVCTGGPLEVIYVGTFSPWQGIETLLKAAHLLKMQHPIRLRLIGPTGRRRREELDRQVRRLGLGSDVELRGACHRGEIVRALHRHHAAVVPLAPVDRNLRQGCCPLKMLEAMASGCPVVASDLPVVRELAVPGVHFLPFHPGSAADLARALFRLATEPSLGRSLAAQAREHVAGRYTWDQAARRLLELYDSLLSSSASRHPSRCSSTAGE